MFQELHTIALLDGQLPSAVAPPGVFHTLARQDRGHFQAQGIRLLENSRAVSCSAFLEVQSPIRRLPGYLGWVDLDLGCSTILLGQ